MQIDLHHAMTWVVARDAGFSVEDATTIAYAGQYVDDATSHGIIRFNTGAVYERTATAHKMLDYRNLKSMLNMKVWVPFHFLPGNDGKAAGENVDGKFIKKLVCKPHSYVAKDMVEECIKDKGRKYGLHRLGITSHVFIDTWGHKGFAGVNHEINEVTEIMDLNGRRDASAMDRVTSFFKHCIQDDIPSLGHGQALSHPDLPHQQWKYINGLGEEVVRDNTKDFLEAANELCRVYRRYLAADENGVEPNRTQHQGLSSNVEAAIKDCFINFASHDGEERHKKWLKAIKDDKFGLGDHKLTYVPKGKGSWKYQALGRTRHEGDDSLYKFTPEFIDSDWKLFHDAAKKHRLTIIQDILPKYGICVS